MTIMRGVNLAEPDDIETLNLATVGIHKWNTIEYVRIGVLEKDAKGPGGTISLALVQYGLEHEGGVKVLQANLQMREIVLLIAGLQKAKERMEAFNAVR